MPRHKTLLAIVFSSLATGTFAASCPADAPEGYQWLSGYVDEFRADGTVSSWFTDSLSQHPNDYALLGLQAFLDADGDVDAGRNLFVERGGSADRFDIAMACAKVQ